MNSLRKHYHWVIAFVVLIELAVFSGILNNIISVHLIPVTEDLGISRGSLSLALSVRPLVGFFATLFSGIFLVKMGFRKLATVFLAVGAVGLALLGSSQNALMLGIASALMGFSEAFCTTTVASRVVTTWFHSRQGMILGFVTASTGLGGSLFSIILTGVSERGSWRHSYFLCAALTGIVAVLIFLLARNRPEDMGLLPFGASAGSHTTKARKASRDHWAGYDTKDVLHKPTFYLTMVVVFFSCICTYAAFSVMVPHLQDCGMNPEDAASVQSIMLLSLAAAKFICGSLSDILGAKFINMHHCGFFGCFICNLVNNIEAKINLVLVFKINTL